MKTLVNPVLSDGLFEKKELIKIESTGEIKTVNARELWEYLESKQEFANWIKNRIENYGFEEGKDFLTTLSKSNGGRPGIEYHISIEMAKELSMVENNEKGKQARKYFIECEKKLQLALPKTFSEALRLAADQAEQIEVMKPKAIVYDQFLSAPGFQTMNEVAKILGIGRNIMMARLRNCNIFLPNNTPYQKYMDKGFKVIDKVQNGFKIPQTFADSKGIEFIKKVLDNQRTAVI